MDRLRQDRGVLPRRDSPPALLRGGCGFRSHVKLPSRGRVGFRGCVVVCGILVAAATAQAQITGRVQDASGTPVDAALVELWTATRRLAVTGTGKQGSFSFPNVDADSAALLLIRRIGYQPLRLPLGADRTLLVATLLPLPINLSPIVAAPDWRPCPNRDDPRARTLWISVRDRYRRPGSEYWAEGRMAQQRVSSRALGAPDTLMLRKSQVLARDPYFVLSTARIRDSGYAVPAHGIREERFEWWEYPYLESLLAAHFVDSLFGRLHTLSFANEQTPYTIAFCSNRKRLPHIEGVLELDPDTSLARVTWRFVTEPHSEAAGGEVWFARRRSTHGPQPLFPMTGLFWRKLVFDFFQEWREYREWHECTYVAAVGGCSDQRQ